MCESALWLTVVCGSASDVTLYGAPHFTSHAPRGIKLTGEDWANSLRKVFKEDASAFSKYASTLPEFSVRIERNPDFQTASPNKPPVLSSRFITGPSSMSEVSVLDGCVLIGLKFLILLGLDGLGLKTVIDPARQRRASEAAVAGWARPRVQSRPREVSLPTRSWSQQTMSWMEASPGSECPWPIPSPLSQAQEIRLLQGGDMYSHTKAHVSTSFPHVFGGSGEFCFHMFSECLSFSSTCAGLQDRSCLGFPVKGLLFFVLCNRHWFNKAPGPDPRGTEMGVIYLCV